MVLDVFPAHAGMDRGGASRNWTRRCVPRPRGDGPEGRQYTIWVMTCSPPTRGWTESVCFSGVRGIVFPAHAGMDRNTRTRSGSRRCVPRPRGDGPEEKGLNEAILECSPPTRGWTDEAIRRLSERLVFPAHAGMDRQRKASRGHQPSVPRPRGDGPTRRFVACPNVSCSPPTRGWTGAPERARKPSRVFPAHAGMDRKDVNPRNSKLGVPRPRGDGPNTLGKASWDRGCSPPTRGWTGMGGHSIGAVVVFPAHAGMDRCWRTCRRM